MPVFLYPNIYSSLQDSFSWGIRMTTKKKEKNPKAQQRKLCQTAFLAFNLNMTYKNIDWKHFSELLIPLFLGIVPDKCTSSILIQLLWADPQGKQYHCCFSKEEMQHVPSSGCVS